MTGVVFVFPGQGSHRAGMGRDFDAEYAGARAAFDEASDALGLDLRRLCFDADDRLARTEFQQPAILAMEIAALRCLRDDHGIAATHYGGHSLGEYAALVAAGVMELGTAAGLVHERGRMMRDAIEPGVGGMMAVLAPRLDQAAIERCTAGLCVEIAGVNAPGHFVLSGLSEDLLAAGARLRGLAGALQTRSLQVSTPFHSRLIAAVEPRFRMKLEEAAGAWRLAGLRTVTSNYTGGFHEGGRAALVEALTRQIAGRVRWMENAEALAALAPARVVEIGPSSALRHSFVRTRTPFSSVTCIGEARALARTLGGS